MQGELDLSVIVPVAFGTAEVTVMMPSAFVATDETYSLVAAADSQPQLFAPGATVAVWYTSVTDVRQLLAARITSDTLARFE